jgi:predicted amidophosphoribosyltransferase
MERVAVERIVCGNCGLHVSLAEDICWRCEIEHPPLRVVEEQEDQHGSGTGNSQA